MPKLQSIKRANGSVVYSVNLPLDIIEMLSWKKGDELNIICHDELNIIITKGEDYGYD